MSNSSCDFWRSWKLFVQFCNIHQEIENLNTYFWTHIYSKKYTSIVRIYIHRGWRIRQTTSSSVENCAGSHLVLLTEWKSRASTGSEKSHEHQSANEHSAVSITVLTMGSWAKIMPIVEPLFSNKWALGEHGEPLLLLGTARADGSAEIRMCSWGEVRRWSPEFTLKSHSNQQYNQHRPWPLTTATSMAVYHHWPAKMSVPHAVVVVACRRKPNASHRPQAAFGAWHLHWWLLEARHEVISIAVASPGSIQSTNSALLEWILVKKQQHLTTRISNPPTLRFNSCDGKSKLVAQEPSLYLGKWCRQIMTRVTGVWFSPSSSIKHMLNRGFWPWPTSVGKTIREHVSLTPPKPPLTIAHEKLNHQPFLATLINHYQSPLVISHQ